MDEIVLDPEPDFTTGLQSWSPELELDLVEDPNFDLPEGTEEELEALAAELLEWSHYEIEGRKVGGGEWVPMGTAPATESTAFIDSLPQGEEWEFRVRGATVEGRFSEWSEAVVAVLPVDVEPPAKPAPPILEQKLGVIGVHVTGKDDFGNDIGGDLDYFRAEVLLDGVWTEQGRTPGPGYLTLAGLPARVELQVRLVAVDLAGNASEPSGSSVITVEQLVDSEAIRTALVAAGAPELVQAWMGQFVKVSADMIEANAVQAMHMDAGSVQARHLQVESVDPTTGYKIQMDATGVRLFDADGNLATSLSTSDPQYFRILNALGETLSSMDSEGIVTAQEVHAANNVSVAGRPLEGGPGSIMWELPRGVVPGSVAKRDMSGQASTAAEWGFLETSFDVEAGRQYAVHVAPFSVWAEGQSSTWFRIRYTTGNVVPTVTSLPLHSTAASAEVGGVLQFSGPIEYRAEHTGRVSMLISVANPVGVRFPAYVGNVRTWAEDIGPARNLGGRDRNSTPANAMDVATVANGEHLYSLNSNHWGTWYHAGALYTDKYTTQWRVYQGPNNGTGSRLYGVQAFDPDVALYADAEITDAWVEFVVGGTHNRSGAWIELNLHGQRYAQNRDGFVPIGSVFAKAGERVRFKIPSEHWAGIKAGTYRGIGFYHGTTETASRTAYIKAPETSWNIRYRK